MGLEVIKVRLYPNKTQEQQLLRAMGCCRFLYNHMLAERIKVWDELKDDKKKLYGYKYRTEKSYKEEFQFLKEVDSVALQQARRDLESAYQNFYKRVRKGAKEKGFPKFKRRDDKNSFRVQNTADNIKFDSSRHKIKIPKTSWMTYRDNRVVDGKLKIITVSRTRTGKFYASLVFEVADKPNPPVQKTNGQKVKGVDMSFSKFFVDDEGNSPEYVRLFRKHEQKLASIHKRISASKSKVLKRRLWLRANRIHEKIANSRKDFIEKLSTKLVQENDVIALESLSLVEMSQTEDYGKSVYDLGWGMFVERLKQKAEKHGVQIIQASRWFPSTQTCHVCGYRNRELTLDDRVWTCPKCGTELLRDQNAATNLKNLFPGQELSLAPFK